MDGGEGKLGPRRPARQVELISESRTRVELLESEKADYEDASL